ncbi:MAG: ABC transporter permease [Gemmatimonadales bacterium]
MPTSLGHEIRHATRSLLRAPAVTISAVLCLGLGLGVTTAISSAIDRALLQPLPFRQAERLVTVYRTTPQFNTGPFSAPNYADLAAASRQISDLAAVASGTGLLSLPSGGVEVRAYRATGNLFPLLGVPAELGRFLTPADDRRDAAPVAVLSDELWRERFGGDRAIIGQSVLLEGRQVTVVGVAPREFRVPLGTQILRSDVWLPMQFSDRELGARRNNYLRALGRLAPGATPAAAESELRAIFNGIVEVYPQLNGESIRVLPLQPELTRPVKTPLLLLFGAVVLVLLIAATNVASLLLARGVERRREMAIRTALGGSPWAVMRPVLVESLVLAGAGVALGLALAWIGVRTIGTLASQRLPQLAGLAIDARVIGFALVLSALVALLCGVVPAWRSTAVDPQEALAGGRGGGAGQAHHRALGTLVVVEVALSLVLLLGAGLVLKGFARLLGNDPGFDPEPVLTLQVTVSPERYADGSSVRQFLEPALDAIRQVPGVAAAGSISLLPYENWGNNFNIRYEGQPGDNPTQLPLVENRRVTPGFFAVTGQRLISGRLLEPSDDERPESPAVVVANQALAARDFGGRDPVGKRFHIGDTTFATIVGVVSNIRNFGPVEDPRPEVYWAYRQSGSPASFPILVRVQGSDPTAVARQVQAAVLSVDVGAAITAIRPMPELMASSVGRPKFYLSLLGVFAFVAVVLAMAGLYGVMSYTVAQRTREIGIRSALGSSTGRTLRLVALQGMRLVAVGLVIGLAGGVAASRLLQSLLYGVSPVDPPTWMLVSAGLMLAGLVATLIPAQRASRVQPVIAMRGE